MITIRHLQKKYPNVTPLQDVNTQIHKGEVISIIGPSGTGKSTFLRCINLLEKPTAGEILINGLPITAAKADVPALRRKMGMVFQSFNLFNHLSVIQNITAAPIDLLHVPKEKAYERGMELLRTVGLADKAESYPDELSGGQKQRVAIARTLAMNPEIVLFDEPTSALDPTMVGEVLSVIRNLARQGLTMLIVTHEMRFARDVSTRIFYMDEGVIYEEGRPDEIFENPKKEKTRQFINHLKVFEEDITNHDFDFVSVTSRLEDFGRKQQIAQKTIRNMQLAFEELVMQVLIPSFAASFNLTFTAEYSEEQGRVTLRLCYDGAELNPLERVDEVSQKLLTRITSDYSHTFSDGMNRIEMSIA
mgnify:CR=1 FL=1